MQTVAGWQKRGGKKLTKNKNKKKKEKELKIHNLTRKI